MSVLVLVRHGQTRGFLTDGYVHLTDLGRRQAEALGRWLHEREVQPDAVFVGPQLRHAETHDLAREAAGGGWPEPVLLDALDEHQGLRVMAWAVQQGRIPLDVLTRSGDDAEHGATSLGMLRAFQRVMREWVAGGLDVPDVEPWPDFRARVRQGLQRMCDLEARGRTVLAFTSGGFVGCATASVVGAPSEEVALDLSFAVSNTSLTEVRFAASRFGLSVFNGTPHLGADAPRSAV